MRNFRSRIAVTIAGSALLASGLSAAAVAVASAAAAPAVSAASSSAYNPNVTLTDP